MKLDAISPINTRFLVGAQSIASRTQPALSCTTTVVPGSLNARRPVPGSRARAASGIARVPALGTSLKYRKEEKYDSDQMKASRL